MILLIVAMSVIAYIILGVFTAFVCDALDVKKGRTPDDDNFMIGIFWPLGLVTGIAIGIKNLPWAKVGGKPMELTRSLAYKMVGAKPNESRYDY